MPVFGKSPGYTTQLEYSTRAGESHDPVKNSSSDWSVDLEKESAGIGPMSQIITYPECIYDISIYIVLYMYINKLLSPYSVTLQSTILCYLLFRGYVCSLE